MHKKKFSATAISKKIIQLGLLSLWLYSGTRIGSNSKLFPVITNFKTFKQYGKWTLFLTIYSIIMTTLIDKLD